MKNKLSRKGDEKNTCILVLTSGTKRHNFENDAQTLVIKLYKYKNTADSRKAKC